MAVGERSLRSQMRQANTMGAAYVLILGEEELVKGTVQVRKMADGSQRELPQSEAVELHQGRFVVKLILSRKGFDSSSGGVPSPIFSDGRMLSLPIPEQDEWAEASV